MPTGVTRMLPFAFISAAIHAAVLMHAPERLEIAVTPGGDTGPVAVRLVPSGATTPDPATQSGVAGSIAESSREQSRPSEPAPAFESPDEATMDESSKPSEPDATDSDRVQAALAERAVTEATPTDTARKRADSADIENTEQRDESRPKPNAATGVANAAASPETRTADTPDTSEKPEASETSATTDTARTPESTQADDTGATNADSGTVDATERISKSDASEVPEDDREAEARSGAEGADDRAQIASRARQQVEIRFRDRFRYPRIARQRGWEGRVVLTFRLQPDGRITDVEVAESSGRSILDENARQTLIHIQRVPEIAERLGPEPLELEVPVTYRLQPA